MTTITNKPTRYLAEPIPPLKKQSGSSFYQIITMLALGALAILAGASQWNTTLTQNCKPVQSSVYESRMMHAGRVAIGTGNMGYVIKGINLRETHPKRVEVTNSIYRELQDNAEIREAERGSETNDYKGIAVVSQDPITHETDSFLFAMNPRKLENHRQAIEQVQSLIQNLDQLPEDQIVDGLIQTHRTLMNGVDSESGQGFRSDAIMVFKGTDEEKNRNRQGLTNLIAKRSPDHAREKNVKLFKEVIASKLQNDQVESLSSEERAVLSLLGYLPPLPQEIPSLMVKYAKNLKSMAHEMKLSEDFDAVAFAAFAHQELGKIHPFGDGNGRMARLIMNGILKMAGFQAAVFPSDEEYTEAVERDAKEPGFFAKYLREFAIPWTKSQFDSCQPCLPDLSC